MTVLEIVNKVLRRLRESQVTALDETEYSSMVTDFLVDIHKDLLDYDWSSMEHVSNIPVDANQRVLDLTRLEADGGDVSADSRLTTIDSIPLWAKWAESSSSDMSYDLYIVSPEEADKEYYLDTSTRVQNPCSIAFRASPNRDGLEALMSPLCDTSRHVRVRFWTPEAEIDPDTDAARTLLVPWRPLWLGTLYLALNERGEELGEPGGLAEQRFLNAVAQAKEADQNRRGNADRYVANRV